VLSCVPHVAWLGWRGAGRFSGRLCLAALAVMPTLDQPAAGGAFSLETHEHGRNSSALAWLNSYGTAHGAANGDAVMSTQSHVCGRNNTEAWLGPCGATPWAAPSATFRAAVKPAGGKGGGREAAERVEEGRCAEGRPTPCSAPLTPQAPLGLTAGLAEDWGADLLVFANQLSVELAVLSTRSGAAGGPWLDCEAGDIVAGVAQGVPSLDAVWCVAYQDDGTRREGALPRRNLEPCSVYKFPLRLNVAPGESLGLRGSVSERGLEIEGVKPRGLVAKWNNRCAATLSRMIVRAGDVVISVNGCTDPAEMLNALRDATSVIATVQRNAT